MCIESAKCISLIAIVCGADVSVICHHEVILSHLILNLRDYWARVLFGNLWQLGCLQELFIILLSKHRLELRSHGNAHLIDFTLLQMIGEMISYIEIEYITSYR
mgnify:CR=1 FL=1